MIKDKLLEQASSTPDDAKAAIVITVLADGTPQVFSTGVTLPGMLRALGAAVSVVGENLTTT